MAMNESSKKHAATIKFFSASNVGDNCSDSSDSDSEALLSEASITHQNSENSAEAVYTGPVDNGCAIQNGTYDTINQQSTNPFDVQFSSDEEDCSRARGRESSIYDPPDLDRSYSGSDLVRSRRERTESDSNMLPSEEEEDLIIINIMDDHFGEPGDLSRIKDIDIEIEKLKQQVFVASADEKKRVVEKIVSLRLRRDALSDGVNSPAQEVGKHVYGHTFYTKDKSGEGEKYCEVCGTLVWGMLQSWLVCTSCHICCHEKCLNALKRMCAATRVKDLPVYNMEICHDQGLHTQNYKCHECKVEISYKPGGLEPRLCDYTGNYYCPKCHWYDTSIIPARVIHNWDFEVHKVSRSSKQFLSLMIRKPALSIKTLNAKLLSFVEELKEMQRIREEILMMKGYFLSCQSALQSKLLLKLSDRQHFVENSDSYSMYDLVELVNERLLPKIVNIHALFSAHIKYECDVCKGKGYYCELCGKSEILFPFDNICVLCKECTNVFHKYCYAKNPQCPRCARRIKRQEENKRKAEILRQIEQANNY